MAQIKIYGIKEALNPIKEQLSDVIHSAVVDAFQYPPDKRFHRFFPMNQEDFIFAHDRSEAYTIIEISVFEGRTTEAKKHLIQLLFQSINDLGIAPQDLEITIFETPKQNWGIRGVPGDELQLDYKVNI
ncbi:4-oxalocrotonate tautomerase [Paenibacillus sp. IHB B 3084]|uniref:tautomerase family protein n=1 Tax=Paenibacillus sp. IHB B 3084 TaxID=867076 RepID=UPI000721CDB5|nr:tautomerase family protein [Paenibacillus sp. IHB B 3084]ALP38305.1 4-oxalocrotonate tautomerase [Paenibacillus sp. IHB B 3084]